VLDEARFVDISDHGSHVSTSLDHILDTPGRVVRAAIAPPAQSLLPPHPASLDGLPPKIARAFLQPVQLPSPALYLLRDAVAFFHFSLSLDDRIVTGSDFSPSFYRNETHRLLAHFARLPRSRPKLEIGEPVYVPWLWKYHEYGHFLIEMVPRILLIHDLYDLGLTFRVLVPRNPAYVYEAVQTLAPDLRLWCVDDYKTTLNCSSCLVPVSGSIDHILHPHTGDVVGSAVARLAGRSARSAPTLQPARIFLSRQEFRKTRGTDFRVLTNEAELAEIARSHGLDVVEPQLLPFADQVRLMSKADVVVGEASSALHNTLFAGKADVISLGWVNNVQTMIAGLRSQHLTYLLPAHRPDSWEYKLAPLDEIQPEMIFSIDARVFETGLVEALQRADDLIPSGSIRSET
jgi:capsular polysaccharide biosynthesis protein